MRFAPTASVCGVSKGVTEVHRRLPNIKKKRRCIYMDEKKRLFSVSEVLEIIPISRAGLYSAIRRKEIASVGVGRRVFVPRWALEALLKEPEACRQ